MIRQMLYKLFRPFVREDIEQVLAENFNEKMEYINRDRYDLETEEYIKSTLKGNGKNFVDPEKSARYIKE